MRAPKYYTRVHSPVYWSLFLIHLNGKLTFRMRDFLLRLTSKIVWRIINISVIQPVITRYLSLNKFMAAMDKLYQEMLKDGFVLSLIWLMIVNECDTRDYYSNRNSHMSLCLSLGLCVSLVGLYLMYVPI